MSKRSPKEIAVSHGAESSDSVLFYACFRQGFFTSFLKIDARENRGFISPGSFAFLMLTVIGINEFVDQFVYSGRACDAMLFVTVSDTDPFNVFCIFQFEQFLITYESGKGTARITFKAYPSRFAFFVLEESTDPLDSLHFVVRTIKGIERVVVGIIQTETLRF